jgi:hypothetical protein
MWSYWLASTHHQGKMLTIYNFKVIMPRSWTPNMYLGVLNQSIMTNSLLTLKPINGSGRNYTTMNKLLQK